MKRDFLRLFYNDEFVVDIDEITMLGRWRNETEKKTYADADGMLDDILHQHVAFPF